MNLDVISGLTQETFFPLVFNALWLLRTIPNICVVQWNGYDVCINGFRHLLCTISQKALTKHH